MSKLTAWWHRLMPPAPPVAPITREPTKPQGAERWMALAQKELGVHETPGPKSTARILEYRHLAGCDAIKGDDGAVAWCRIFVAAVMVEAQLPVKLGVALARTVEHDPDFVKLNGPAYGAVCSFWRTSKTSGLGHTGFYVGQSEDGARIRVLGGNQSDSVCYSWSPKARLVGYYWPKSLPLPAIAPIVLDDDGEPEGSET